MTRVAGEVSSVSVDMNESKLIAIRALGISVKAENEWLLNDVNLSVQAGCWTAIVGPNGAGKSTLLRSMAGLGQANALARGDVSLLGKPMAEWTARSKAQTMSWLGQNEVVTHDLNCYDLVMLGRLPHQAWLAQPSENDHGAVEQAMRQTHSWNWRHRAVASLSGGERQRVLLARALAVQAEVILMDEPLVNLDPPHQSDWMETVQTLVAKGRTVVSVLHELHVALQSDRMVIMGDGKIQHHGRTSDPQTHRALEAVFDDRIAICAVEGTLIALPRKRIC